MRKAVSATVAMIAVHFATPVMAQSPQPPVAGGRENATEIQEVIVTARKREESLRDVPLSVTVFAAENISRAGIVDLEGISQRTPGLNFNTNLGTLYPGREGTSIRFRGIGDAEGAEITKLQPTSVFIDGAFVLNGAQSIGLDDLERVEVIKGPQAATFGRNSFAGAINYITRNPSLSEFRGRVSAQAATYGQFDVSASIEAPLVSDALSFMLSGRLYHKGSMYAASDGGELGEESSQSVSGVLLYKPIDALTAKLRISYQQDDDGPAASAFIPGRLADTCTGTSRPGLDDEGRSVTLRPAGFICGSVPQVGSLRFDAIDSNTSLRPASPIFRTNPTILSAQLLNDGRLRGVPQLDGFGLQRNIFRTALNLTYEFPGGTTLTALGTYNDNVAAVLRDLDLTSVESWYQYNARKGSDKGIDIQLASPGAGRLTWLAGLNYYRQDFLTSATGGSFVSACPFPGLCPLYLPVGNDGGDSARVLSGYGALSYRITERLTIGAEGRYQVDKRSDGVSALEQSYKKFLPRITASFKVTDEVTLFANASRGFLPGLVNGVILTCNTRSYTTPFISPITGQPSTASECEQMRQQLGADFAGFTTSQTLDAYEGGVKAALLDDRLRLNLSAYQYRWHNQPSSNFVTVYRDDDGDGAPNGTINALQIFTSGSSKSHGIEADFNLRPTGNLELEGGIAYNSNEYVDYLGLTTFARANGGSRNFAGNGAPRNPEWSGNFAVTFRRFLSSALAAFGRAEVTYQGRVFTGSENLATIDPYALVNARVGFEKDEWRVELFANNLFKQDNWRSGLSFFDVANPADPGTFDFNNLGVTVVPQDKRTIGVKAVARF